MELTIIVINRIIVMFIVMAIGYRLYKKGKISNEGSKTLANVLVYVTLPCVIMNSFFSERTPEKIRIILISMALSIACLAVSAIVARVIYKGKPIDIFAATFSNPGFFGIPIIAAVFDQTAVFNITTFIAFLNIGQWTYGVSLLKGEKVNLKLSTLIMSPFIISTIAGLTIFFTGVEVPGVVRDAILMGNGANSLLAMLVLGVYLAQVDLKDLLIDKRLYGLSMVRLIIIPLVCLIMLNIIPNMYFELKVCLLIASACPVGANVAVYAQMYNSNYKYAVETVTHSTILSLLTLPVMIYLIQIMGN